ncbi:hypothetical protein [Marivita hallyeonensis]|uniref:Peptidase propeptide and YPEB domain-containing protein n=1 Tax=Marivita hallyeonensis TaxID=996342 RepID=A0A1M5NRX8_9RHOB|nr:hypothetical protein [Marivita hallyeonensis]SHG92228.1 hypothetical protein SAMN05443551_1024 [Marivita hallyeonensis]
MNRRQILTGVLAATLLPSTAFAQTAQDQVIDQLQRQGYNRFTLGRTLLGRTRIVATGPSGRREIILNPSTGAILRDYVDRSARGDDDDSDDREDREDDRDDDEENSGRGSGGDRDDDDDDDRDNSGRGGGGDRDDDDRDNSGSGGGGRDDDDDDDGGGDDDDDDD